MNGRHSGLSHCPTLLESGTVGQGQVGHVRGAGQPEQVGQGEWMETNSEAP